MENREIYALKYGSKIYYDFTDDYSKVEKYFGQKTLYPVKVKLEKNNDGKYWLYENDNFFICEGIGVIFNKRIEGLPKGSISKVSIVEI